MLVLTRKIDQSIVIGDNIKIIIVDVRGDQVKLGIEAPKDVSVHREEVYEDIQQENRRAVVSQSINIDELDRLLKRSKNGGH